MTEMTKYCLTKMDRIFGEHQLIKHNQRQRTVFFQLAREGSFTEMVRHKNGKSFVKSFRTNEILMRKVKHAKSKQVRADSKNHQ